MCPYCGEEPPNPRLKLYSLSTSDHPNGTRIHHGVIYCEGCTRFYMIHDEILYMSGDNLRDQQSELEFLTKWQNELPDIITKQSKPHNLQRH